MNNVVFAALAAFVGAGIHWAVAGQLPPAPVVIAPAIHRHVPDRWDKARKLYQSTGKDVLLAHSKDGMQIILLDGYGRRPK